MNLSHSNRIAMLGALFDSGICKRIYGTDAGEGVCWAVVFPVAGDKTPFWKEGDSWNLMCGGRWEGVCRLFLNSPNPPTYSGRGWPIPSPLGFELTRKTYSMGTNSSVNYKYSHYCFADETQNNAIGQMTSFLPLVRRICFPPSIRIKLELVE